MTAKRDIKRYASTIERMKKVREVVDQHYEPGNYARSKYQVWLQHVHPEFRICYDTMLKYLNEDLSELESGNAQEDKRQLKLFDE